MTPPDAFAAPTSAPGASTEQGDVLVLGAGMVGASIAAHLQMRGLKTILVDRQGPGEGTSFGNACQIQREAVLPHPFPRSLSLLMRYARNNSIDAYYHTAMLPKLLSPFYQFWKNSHPDRYKVIAKDWAALIAECIDDHMDLATKAGATDLLRPGGYLTVYRDGHQMQEHLHEAEIAKRDFGVEYDVMDAAGLAQVEPHLRTGLTGATRWTQPLTAMDPHLLTAAYARYFQSLGGSMVTGDARSLSAGGAGWLVKTADGAATAPRAVLALGPWGPDVSARFGYKPPMFVKRGYHMHYRPDGNAVLNNPVQDIANGYMIIPMLKGIRLTTGAEFADRDAAPTPVQLGRAEPKARDLMPMLGTRTDAEPWMGSRPCTPDMLPIIGPAPGQKGLWYAFGHAHQGLTLGPTTGRLLGQMMTGETPFTDPTPYRPERFS